MTRRANRKKRFPVLYITEHPNPEGDTCIDWTSQYCWTNGWNCLWRGHSVYRNRPLIPPFLHFAAAGEHRRPWQFLTGAARSRPSFGFPVFLCPVWRAAELGHPAIPQLGFAASLSLSTVCSIFPPGSPEPPKDPGWRHCLSCPMYQVLRMRYRPSDGCSSYTVALSCRQGGSRERAGPRGAELRCCPGLAPLRSV